MRNKIKIAAAVFCLVYLIAFSAFVNVKAMQERRTKDAHIRQLEARVADLERRWG